MINIKDLRELSKEFNILYVEDDEEISKSMLSYLTKIFKNVDYAYNGEDGLNLYNQNSYDLVMTDIQMPKVNGLEMSSIIKEKNSEQNIIIVSAYADVDKFTDSIRIGVDGYILKPIDYNNLNQVLYKTMTKINKFKEHALYEKDLELLVKKKIDENRELELEKIKNYKQTLYSLIDLIESRDNYTSKHSIRVATYSKLIAEEMGFSKNECEEIYIAGMLHDIGKVAIPDSLLLKPSKFNTNDYELVKEHVNIGFNMLNQIDMFKSVAQIVKSHHERLDGTGYPNGLKGDEIPISANIMAVADSFDAMTTNRVYKKSKSVYNALEELKELTGVKFRKDVIDVASDIFKNIVINTDINQLPTTNMEQERFSYFYNDNMTGLFNELYLDYILVVNIIKNSYKEINFITLDNFGEVNKKYGWLKGNEFLASFSKYLKEVTNYRLVFRIYGNHFIIITEKNENFDENHIEKLNQYSYDNFDFLKINLKKINIINNNIDSISSLEKYM